MKYLKVILLLGLPFYSGLVSHVSAQEADTVVVAVDTTSIEYLWEKVYNLEIRGLNRKALTKVNEIYEKVSIDKGGVNVIKALIYRSKFTLLLEDEAQLKTIEGIKTELAQSDSKGLLKPMLHSIVAELYLKAFQRNPYLYYNRTETKAKVDSVDFRTWDANTILKEIHNHYQSSLNLTRLQKNMDIEAIQSLLRSDSSASEYHPTLYDFLAHRAVQFYGTVPMIELDVSSKQKLKNSSLFSDSEDFLKIDFNAILGERYMGNALMIYQDMLTFHQERRDKSAHISWDIERLKFAASQVNENAFEKFIAALEKLRSKHTSHSLLPWITFEQAYAEYRVYKNITPLERPDVKWALKEIAEKCEQIVSSFPSGFYSRKCVELINQINEPSIELRMEQYLPSDESSLLWMKYKNISQLHINVYPLSYEEYLNVQNYNYKEHEDFITKSVALKKYTFKVPNDGDHHQHTTELVLSPLNQGFYVIVASEGASFDPEKTYGVATVQVTDLALVESYFHNKLQYQVVDRKTGLPLSNATVSISNPNRYSQSPRVSEKIETDHNGFAHFYIHEAYNRVQVDVSHKGKRGIFGETYIRHYIIDKEEKSARVFLFMDRSIYRPGQTVYFKGIVVGRENDQSYVLSNELVYVNLSDQNNQDVHEAEFVTNEYGSFSGSFVLPKTGNTGRYSIESYLDSEEYDEDYRDYGFSVEEYKRPKFEVVFDTLSGKYFLEDTVNISGNAQSFAGSSITNATATYKVIRKPRYNWYRYIYGGNSQEVTIAEGVIDTDSNGGYQFNFIASPDPLKSREQQASYTYEINVDVTDINGETQTGTTSINVGYFSYEVFLDIPKRWSKKEKQHKIKVLTKNLEGQDVTASGMISIYKLKGPDRVLRERPWSAPEYPALERAVFVTAFPNEAFKDKENDPLTWEREKIVWQEKWTTKEGEVEDVLNDVNKWRSGHYLIVGNSTDEKGQLIKVEQLIDLYDPKDKKVTDNQLFTIEKNKDYFNVGDELVVKVGSASKDLSVTLTFEQGYRVLETRVLRLKDEIKEIKFKLKEAHIGGLVVKYHYVNMNTFDAGILTIPVNKKKDEIAIETSVFRNILLPGTTEEWQFKISGSNRDVVAAEILASMYDASLDKFVPHEWETDLVYEENYLNLFALSTSDHSFRINSFRFYNSYRQNVIHNGQKYHLLNWYGLDLYNPYNQKNYVRGMMRYRQANVPNGMVRGTVTDPSGEPIIGANITVQGTARGTLTDIDGSFEISVSSDETILVDFTGYETFKLTVQAGRYYDILLAEGVVLDEVVVTGHSMKKESRAMSFSVNHTAEDDVARILRSKATGVDITQTSGLAGSGADVVIRGYSSVDPTIEEEFLDATEVLNSVDFSSIKARKNFSETAFFLPHLRTDSLGNIAFSFEVPESLTEWSFSLFAHTKDLKYATQEYKVITQKKLMVLPNAPRFFRENDEIIFQSKVVNLSKDPLKGASQLELYDALTDEPLSGWIEESTRQQAFEVGAKGNANLSWRINIPEGKSLVKYRIVASAGDYTDGEENILPILTNRTLITESMPMWIYGDTTRTFTMDRLKTNTSTTLTHHELTLEFTSHPVWTALQSLSYLKTYPYDCSEQLFSKYYANALGIHILNSHPKIKEVFDEWKKSGGLEISQLENNETLKTLLLEETPWVMTAKTEVERKQRLAEMFDLVKASQAQVEILDKLKNNQRPSGGFPWFSGGRQNDYISQHILTGFGHLERLGIKQDDIKIIEMLGKGVKHSDQGFIAYYSNKSWSEKRGYSPSHLHYLYMRSFYDHIPKSKALQDTSNMVIRHLNKDWLELSLYQKGLLALVNHRLGNKNMTQKIVDMLVDNAIVNDEKGMYWKQNRRGWYWYQAPIETQALLIELFHETGQSTDLIDKMNMWLLRQKQTTSWRTTKQTTEAVYALLFQGSNLIVQETPVQIWMGDQAVDTYDNEGGSPEAGTGYFKQVWSAEEIKSDMGTVTLSKSDRGIAWGAMYWQYFEDLDKVSSEDDKALSITKKLFINKNDQLLPIDEATSIKVGDRVTVRIELKADRDMDYIHMKDMRASGFEPINVLSGYKYQDGIGYYESTRDAATNFFITRLRKGVYVFEYDLRANNAGDFSNGVTTIESMYAPEFRNHSEGIRIKIAAR